MTRTLFAVLLLASCGPAEVEPARVSADTTGGEDPHSDAAASGDPRMEAMLAAHNAHRAEHCAAPLVWSDALASTAQAWADHLAASGCGLEHSRGSYGENLAAGTEGMLSPQHVTELWYREIDGYSFARGGFSMSTGHFTQLVWVGTRSLGCGVTQCNGLDVWVCNYDPPGNVEGQYRENVLPTSCR